MLVLSNAAGFCENRPLAEEWTFRWLGAALLELIADGELSLD
jgi:hypothetical protein